MQTQLVPITIRTVKQKIEKLLEEAGWSVQSVHSIDFGKGPGVAIREIPLKTGVADYILFIKGFPVGLVIAGENESDVMGFSRYSEFLAVLPGEGVFAEPLRFIYLSSGNETFFTDLKKPNPTARRIFTIHGPSTLHRWYPEIDESAKNFDIMRLIESAQRFSIQILPEQKEEKHIVRIFERVREEEPLILTLKMPQEETSPIGGIRNITINIPQGAKGDFKDIERIDARSVSVIANVPESEEGKTRDGSGRFLPGGRTAVAAIKGKAKSKPLTKVKVVLPKKRKKAKKIKITIKRRKARKYPAAVIGTFGIDKIRNLAGETRDLSAGPASYSAVSSRFFTKTAVAGVVGDDYAIPPELSGIEKSSLAIAKGRKSASTNWKHSKVANAALAPSIRQNVSEEAPKQTKRFSRLAKFVLLGNASPQTQREILKGMRKRPKFLALQIGSQWIGKRKAQILEGVGKADAILLTEKEAKKLSGGEKNPLKAAQKIRSLGPKIVVVKEAEHGVMLLCGDKPFFAPVYPVAKSIDPVGAWESFAGAFVGYLASKGNMSEETTRKAVIWASALSSFKQEGYGLGRLAELKKREVLERVETLKKSVEI